jgi:hypothetical protein
MYMNFAQLTGVPIRKKEGERSPCYSDWTHDLYRLCRATNWAGAIATNWAGAIGLVKIRIELVKLRQRTFGRARIIVHWHCWRNGMGCRRDVYRQHCGQDRGRDIDLESLGRAGGLHSGC